MTQYWHVYDKFIGRPVASYTSMDEAYTSDYVNPHSILYQDGRYYITTKLFGG